MGIKGLIHCDSARYSELRGGVISTYLKRPFFRVVFWYRIICYLKHRKSLKFSIGPFAYLIFRHLEYKYGVFINTNITIGPGLYIEHGGCVYINAKSIGKNLSIFHEVTIGVGTNGMKPVIGDNVTLYMGAKIFGDVILGNDCTVGVNAVVIKNVTKGQVVAGVPAKPIK